MLIFCFAAFNSLPLQSDIHYHIKTKESYFSVNTGKVQIKDVLAALERFAPLPLQEDFDNAGLQVGLTETEVSGALLCLDVTEAIVDEAVRKGCNVIVSHHPLIFHKLRQVAAADYVQRTVMKAIKHDITIISMHTNLDAVEGGVNYKMAEKMHLHNLRFMGAEKSVGGRNGGEGLVGELPEELAADDLVLMLRREFGVECVQCNQLLRRGIRRVALCGGAGSFLLQKAIAAGADAFVTGEMHYHEYFGHDQEIQICVIGHYQSEQYTSEVLRDVLAEACPDVRCDITEINTNPIIYL